MPRPRPLRVLIVPDKFKGTLSAAEAAAALTRGWLSRRPQDLVRPLPLTDGGDGFGDCMRRLTKARGRTIRTVDAAGRSCRCPWWWAEPRRQALVESARCIGLAMLPGGRFHPFQLDTFGLAAVLRAAAGAGARSCVIGIGGSATNDGGFGLARGLGWTFLDRHGRELTAWRELRRLDRVLPPDPHPLGKMSVTVATDVRNPLLGRRGATRVYGPQKGLRAPDRSRAEACLQRLADVVGRAAGPELAVQPGSGAAGGLGFGLTAFAGASLRSGFELYADAAQLDAHLRWADLVVTGEGAVDASTLMGKGVGEIGHRARSLGLPCLALGGTCRPSPELRRLFTWMAGIVPHLTSMEHAQRCPKRWLARLARETARELRVRQGKPDELMLDFTEYD